MAFDRFGALEPRKWVRLYRNVTTDWLELSFRDAGGDTRTLTVTPGHRFLNEHGRFEQVGHIAARGGRIVDADGRILAFEARRIAHDVETAPLYPQAEGMLSREAGALALAAEPVRGWATFNFESKTCTPMSLTASAFTTRATILRHFSPTSATIPPIREPFSEPCRSNRSINTFRRPLPTPME